MTEDDRECKQCENTIEDISSRTKDRWFDHWLTAEGHALASLVGAVAADLAHHECRTRRRPQAAQKAFDRAVAGFVVNLAYLVVRPSDTGRLAIDRNTGKSHTRYDHPALTPSTLDKAFRALEGVEVFRVNRGRSGLNTTTLEPTQAFSEAVSRHGVGVSDFGRDPCEEIIILSTTTKGLRQSKEGLEFRKKSKLIDYADTSSEVRSHRERLRVLNGFLQAANIEFVDDGVVPLVLPEDRVMRRRFTLLKASDEPAWNLNGRLFGGFWQQLERSRRRGLRIDGEPVCNLDFRNAFARLAYAHVGREPPEGDLYDLTGLLAGYDERHPTHRKGVKQGFSALLFGGKAQAPEIVAQLPEGVKAKALREALAAKHPVLASVFGSDLGYTLMYQESCILVRALELLIGEGVVALGMHDGLMVAASHEKAARSAMEAACVEVVGVSLVVDTKAVYGLTSGPGVRLVA